MKDLRIVFMGTPQFAVSTLAAIVDAGYKVVGVVTAPDKPAGRGRKLQETDVKKYALQKGLKVLQPTNLKSEAFLEELRTLQANLQVVVAFRMLPKSVWSLPEYGTFNLHASLLPQYRGAAPINWAIMNGESETGVSTFFIDERIDTGEMILQEKVVITQSETAGSLHDTLMDVGATLVVKTLENIQQGNINSYKQPSQAELKSAPKLTKENTRINWNGPLSETYNFIRGLSPYPAAWTLLKNGEQESRVKIYEAAMEESAHDIVIGKLVLQGKKIKIAVPGGFIELRELQLPGKRKMQVQEFLNGYKFFHNAEML